MADGETGGATEAPTERHWDGPGQDDWTAWTPAEVASRLEGATFAWWIVGGWAIDLFLGEVTRAHEDLEVAVPRTSHHALRRRLGELAFHAVLDGESRRLAPDEDLPAESFQCWGLDEVASRWRLDVMADPSDASTWVYRRDDRIRRPLSVAVVAGGGGVPYLRPEVVLLYKAKAARPKDEADLEACLPRLGTDAVEWLAGALELLHPGHRWLDRLT